LLFSLSSGEIKGGFAGKMAGRAVFGGLTTTKRKIYFWRMEKKKIIKLT